VIVGVLVFCALMYAVFGIGSSGGGSIDGGSGRGATTGMTP